MEAPKRKRGRPKGSKSKETIMEEVSPDEVISHVPKDVVLPDVSGDPIAAISDISKEVKKYKAEYSLPRVGNFYVFKIYESNGRSRILISHMDFNDSFPLSERLVMTPFGPTKGLSCPVVLRFVDIVTDPETEEPIGVYQILSTPSMVKTGVDPLKIAGALSDEDIDQQIDTYVRQMALSYKMQRDLWKKYAETYKEEYKNLSERRMEVSEELAATAIELLVNAISATKDMFEEIRKKQLPWYQRYQTEIMIIIGAIAMIILMFMLGGRH